MSDQDIIGRITHWNKRVTNDKVSISSLDGCILEAEKGMQELLDLRKGADGYLETSKERLDYWLQRYEKVEE